MYLQAALYALKSYGGFMTKGKPLPDSLKYIEKFQDLSDVQFSGNKPWTMEEMRDTIIKTLSYLLQEIGTRIANKSEG